MKASTLLWAVAVVVVLGGIAWAGITFPMVSTAVGSPAGSYFSTSKIASVNIVPSSIAASSTSILNTDASARIIINNQFACVGTNGIGESVIAATTTVANLGIQGNTNYIMANNFATTTTTNNIEFMVSSTTDGVLTGTSRIWPAGTYLTFVVGTTTNANFVNNSATCTVVAHYLAT